MSRTFTKIPTDTFETLQLNAGILVGEFDPATKQFDNILGATSGGVQFNDAVDFVDWGEDVDNARKNTKELKMINGRTVTMSGTFVSVSSAVVKMLMGAADVDTNNSKHIIPRDDLKDEDFSDIWWIGDYGSDGGFMAIHLINALSTTGFQIQTGDKAKGQFAFQFTGHYTMEDEEVVPYEIYIENEATAEPGVLLNKHSVTVENGETVTLKARVTPTGQTVTWTSGSSSVATVSGGVVTAEGTGNTIVTASITVNGVSYTDTCTVKVVAAA